VVLPRSVTKTWFIEGLMVDLPCRRSSLVGRTAWTAGRRRGFPAVCLCKAIRLGRARCCALRSTRWGTVELLVVGSTVCT